MKIIKFTGVIENVDSEYAKLRNLKNSQIVVVRKNEILEPEIGKVVTLILSPVKGLLNSKIKNLYKVVAEKNKQKCVSEVNENGVGNQDTEINNFEQIKKFPKKQKVKFTTLFKHLYKAKLQMQSIIVDSERDFSEREKLLQLKKAICLIDELVSLLKELF